MVHHIVLCKLKPGVTPQKLEEMMRRTRTTLLKIDKALAVRCGRNITPGDPWGFFVAVDVESMAKLAAYRDNAHYIKYMEEVLKPNTSQLVSLNYETDPARTLPPSR